MVLQKGHLSLSDGIRLKIIKTEVPIVGRDVVVRTVCDHQLGQQYQAQHKLHPIKTHMRGPAKHHEEFKELLIDNHPKSHKAIDPTLVAAMLVIGDESSRQHPLTLLERVAHFYGKYIGVVRPNNTILLCWDVMIIVTAIFFIMEIGFLIGFRESFWQDELNTIISVHIIIIICLSFDMLLAPCKAFYQDGLLITDSMTILRHYISFEGPLDLLTIISVIIPIATGSLPANWMKIIWILKFHTVSRINDEFERVTQLYISWSTTYLVIKLATVGILYSHFIGIFFYMVSLWVYENNYYGPNTPNICWIYNSIAFDQMVLILDWSQMYTYIMYYSVGLITTIAYGDITPKNPIECIFMIFVLIINTLIFGYLMTEILRLLVNVFSYDFERKLRHFELNQKMQYEKITRGTQEQIRAHTQEVDREEQFRNRQVQEEVLSFLPNEPLFALLVTIYKDFLKDLGLHWSQQFGENPLKGIKILHNHSLFLQNFVKDIKQRRYYAGDVFYKQGQSSDDSTSGHCAYYFTKQLHMGNVRLGMGNIPEINSRRRRVEEHKDKSYDLMPAPRTFGLVEMLNGQERTHWAVCIANSILFVAQRESILRHYHLLTQEQREKLQMLVQGVQDQCLICHKDHPSLQCPFTFYNPTPTDLIRKDDKAYRKHKLLVASRTRLKTLSSWTIYTKIRNQRVQISKQYKDRLLFDHGNHALFMQLQLDQDDAIEEEEPFETRLFQAEVMVDQVYAETREEMSACAMEFQFDQVRSYSIYRPHNNIEIIQKDFNTRERRIAGIQHLIKANLLRIFL